MGDIIQEFASENATIVIGTVIDPSMGDEIKVTVVATGLCSAFDENEILETDTPSAVEIPVLVPPRGTRTPMGAPAPIDYRKFDTPAVGRRNNPTVSAVAAAPSVGISAGMSAGMSRDAKKNDLEFLDIPAFLRRQAD